jgi:hypothetical protein
MHTHSLNFVCCAQQLQGAPAVTVRRQQQQWQMMSIEVTRSRLRQARSAASVLAWYAKQSTDDMGATE